MDDNLDLDMKSLVEDGDFNPSETPSDPPAETSTEETPAAEESVATVAPTESTQPPEESSKEAPSNAALSAFANLLADEGVVSLDENQNIESTNDLVDLIQKTIKENELAHLSDDQKQALKAFENGIPVEEFLKSQSTVQTIANITNEQIESDPKLRRSLIKDSYLAKGFSEDKADRLTQDSFDLGRDVEDAVEAKDDQVKFQKQRIANEIAEQEKQQEAAKKQQEAELKKLKDKVYKEEEIIPGISFNRKTADKVYESMTKVVGEVQGQPINQMMKDRIDNPIDFEHRLHYVYTLTKGFKDFSKLVKTSKSRAVSEFEAKLNNGGETYQAPLSFNSGTSILDKIMENPNIK